MSNYKRWTEEDVSMLKELLSKGWVYKDIAVELGRTREATRGKARELGLTSTWTNTKSGESFAKEFNKAYEDFEYVGGYTNNVSSFKVRCKKCDDVFERNASVLRKGLGIKCDVCSELARQKELERVQKLRAIKLITNRLKRYVDGVERKIALENHVCSECSATFTATSMGTKYCSKRCADRVHDRTKRARRRMRVKLNGNVDVIELGQLITRDDNVCYLCNEDCDRDDYVTTSEGHFIAGETYPSIDHVIPVAKGGTHTWDNVRLAHHRCNLIKSDNLIKELRLTV